MHSYSGHSEEVAPGYIAIGQIVGSWGVRGEVKVVIHTDFPERFSQLETLYLGPEARPIKLLSSRAHQGQVLLRLEGYSDATTAQTLSGQWIQIPAQEVNPLSEGEHYVFQLVGIEVRTTDGRSLGRIEEVLLTPANEVFVVRNAAGGEILVPYINDVIAEEDVAGGVIVVHPVPGLLD